MPQDNAQIDTLLIVEDELVNREILLRYLQQADYQVDTAEDGEIAWNMLQQNPQRYSVVVTDRLMPNLDGLSLFHRMKQEAALKHVPVIMQTAATRDEEVAEGIEAGIFYYLTKPYQEKMLLSVVQAALSEAKQQHVILEQAQKNRQAMGNCTSVAFTFQTLKEAQNIALFLGGFFPDSDHTAIGLYELMSNAVEHGNLAIDYPTKGALLTAGRYEQEITQRLQDPRYAQRKATLSMQQKEGAYHMLITDEGEGFNWQPFLALEPSRATDNHGRGIAKANLLAFDHLQYHGNGNQVECVIQKAAP